MTYYVNTQNTGLENNAQVLILADILQNKGYDVRFTNNWGLVNPSESCPVSDADWDEAIEETLECFK